jgi:hypothetical protein
LLTGLLRQSVCGGLAGYEDVNDADCPADDPAMRAVVDRHGIDRAAASTSQMGLFETAWLTSWANLPVLTDRSGTRSDQVGATRCTRASRRRRSCSISTAASKMIRRLLPGACLRRADTADALAVAVRHAHHRASRARQERHT